MLKSHFSKYFFNYMRFLYLEGFNNLVLQIKQHYVVSCGFNLWTLFALFLRLLALFCVKVSQKLSKDAKYLWSS